MSTIVELDERQTILVVDDTPDNIRLIITLLKQTYKTKIAINGINALHVMSAPPYPDLILLDVMMPEMDGYEVCRRLKADPATASIPIIFLSAMNAPQDEELGLRLGAVDYVPKPISAAILLARIATHLSLNNARRNLENQNSRLERLVNIRTQQLAEQNRTLEQQVADRTADLHAALTTVQGANVRLEGLLNFARFLQHEVRGYAAGLEGLTPLLRQGFASHPQADYYLPRLGGLEDTVAQMNDLTQRMLILTREGQLPIQQHQAIALRPMLAQVRQQTLDFAQHLDLPLEITLADGPDVTVSGDPLYLSLACFTGLRNAVEVLANQDRDDAQIQITTTAENGQVQVRLSDNGPGFPPALLDAITRARQSASGLVIGWSSKSGGSGLGLALMDRVAQLHGGSLTVGNRDDGSGAWVALTFPIRG